MRSCVIGIAVLAIVLDMHLGLLDGLPAPRGQGDRSARKQQPAATGAGVANQQSDALQKSSSAASDVSLARFALRIIRAMQ